MRHKICFLDLDGTVNSSSAVRDHLLPHNGNFERNWAPWHAAHMEETRNIGIIHVVTALAADGWRIVLLSMRGDQCADSTLNQLHSWGVPAHSWILKSPGDNRKPAVYKVDEITSYLIAALHMRQELDVLVIDDSADVCEAVRKMAAVGGSKVNVLQVESFKG